MRVLRKRFYTFFACTLICMMFAASQNNTKWYEEEYIDANETGFVELHYNQSNLADMKIIVRDPGIDCMIIWYPAHNTARFTCKSIQRSTRTADLELAELCYSHILAYRFLNEFNLESFNIPKPPRISYKTVQGVPLFYWEREFYVQKR